MPKLSGMERIMLRGYGIPSKVIDGIERSAAELKHGHAMLAELYPEEHKQIHSLCIDPELKDAPKDIQETATVGGCLYKMIGFLYAKKFGIAQFNKSRDAFPELK